ncbi:MAG: hypothetical protein CVV27_05000 [Candidatus Melainabacteria bacterium HGW-Melainabacteria-1]|nr:MAG: hypothetical protein CVV27_05000 [Candidatus Melainabacteria bacterium HGW-Melainabacteria-1]
MTLPSSEFILYHALNMSRTTYSKHFSPQSYFDENNEVLEEISHLSKINIFVGENNSGKSRLLRALCEGKPLRYKLKGYPLEEAFSGIETLLKECTQLRNFQHYDKIVFDDTSLTEWSRGMTTQFLANQLSILNLEEKVYFSENYFKNATSIPGFYDDLSKFRDHSFSAIGKYGSPNTVGVEIKNLFTKFSSDIDLIGKISELHHTGFINPIRCYIPILRTLNNLTGNKEKSETFLADRIRSKYFQDSNETSLEIFTGQTLYHQVKDLLLGNKSERQKIAAFEEFLSQELFNGVPVSLIPRKDHLGDAIQQVILLTFPIFEHKGESTLFFIEEPELNLHPALQRKFIDLLCRQTNHQFFISTHSNHLLDLTLDHKNMSVFTFRKQSEDPDHETFMVRNVQAGDESILSLLGVQNSSIFLANCTIWVEGITDRRYIREYFNHYLAWIQNSHPKHYHPLQEDLDYAFIEYSGGNIAHWSFLEPSILDGLCSEDDRMTARRLIRNIFLIADQDGPENKLERKAELLAALGDQFYLLTCREIENLLPPSIIQHIISYHELRKDLDFVFPRDFTQVEYQNIGLGKFIHENLFSEHNPPKRKGGYTAESGTLKPNVKEDFCERALPLICWDNMSPDSKILAKSLYRFILRQKFPGKSFDDLPLDLLKKIASESDTQEKAL